jgi:hypothetical protein
MEAEVWTRCKICVWDKGCHKDAKDPDCWPYGTGCDEFTTQKDLDRTTSKQDQKRLFGFGG